MRTFYVLWFPKEKKFGGIDSASGGYPYPCDEDPFYGHVRRFTNIGHARDYHTMFKSQGIQIKVLRVMHEVEDLDLTPSAD